MVAMTLILSFTLKTHSGLFHTQTETDPFNSQSLVTRLIVPPNV